MALLKFLLLFMQPLQRISSHLQMDDMMESIQYSHREEINNIWELEDNPPSGGLRGTESAIGRKTEANTGGAQQCKNCHE